MPTLFERLDTGLQGNAVSVSITAQSSSLGAVATTVAGLIEKPPSNLGDLGRAIQELDLPDLSVGAGYAAGLRSLREAVPADLSSVIGPLTDGLLGLQVTVSGDLTGTLERTLGAVEALERLLGFADSGGEGGAGGDGAAGSGAPPPAGGPPPAGATPPTTAAALDQANAALDGLPSPLNVDSFLGWLASILTDAGLQRLLRRIPLLDGLRDPLDTLVTWKGMTPDQIRDSMAVTLADLGAFFRSGIDTALAPSLGGLTGIAGSLPAAALDQIADDLRARLVELRAAVQGANAAGITAAVDAINTLLDQYDARRPAFDTNVTAALGPLGARLRALPDDLDEAMGRLLSVVRPEASLGILEAASSQVRDAATTDALGELEQTLAATVDWFERLIALIDLAALRPPLETVAENARAAVDSLDAALVGVTLDVQALLGRVGSLLNAVDTEAIAEQVQTAVNDFRVALLAQLTALVQPVQKAVQQIIESLDKGVGAFKPADVVEGLRTVIGSITGVLKDTEVVSVLDGIRGALQEAADRLEALSFAPLTDEVIQEIESVTAALQSIDTTKLSAPLQLALQAALAILPEDLTPITAPIVADFGKLIAEGPAPLLASVREQPRLLLERVRAFEPGALVGGALSQPYKDLLAVMDGFQPGRLLDPVAGELDRLKSRLRESADPGRAIQLLEPPFQELLAAFDRLNPDQIVQPLEESVKQVIESLLGAVPAAEGLDQVEAVLQRVKDAAGVGSSLAALLGKVHDLLGGFADAPGQVSAWLDAILDKVEAIADAGPVQARLTELTAAVDVTRAEALAERFAAAADPLLDALDDLDSRTRLTAVVQAYRGIARPAVDVLPDSPAKTALRALLTRFDPLRPAFAAPYEALDDLRGAVSGAKTAVQTLLDGWDARYHVADGALSVLRGLEATPARLRQWIEEDLQPRFVALLTALFALLEPVRGTVGVFQAQMQRLVTDLDARLADLLAGPNALLGIIDAIQDLIQRLRDFDLGFLRDSLGDLFAGVRGKLEAVDPAPLRQAVSPAFEAMLAALTLGQIFPPADVAKLDAAYEQVVNKLRALDPEKLVTEVVQPEFEKTIPPLLEPFDLTPLLTALQSRLEALEQELQSELARVNQAYKALRGAVPSISISIDIGVELPF